MKDFLPKRLISSPDESVIKWLLYSDPSIRWQVMNDITKEPDEKVKSERTRIAAEGWGSQLIKLQSPEGHWWPDIDPWPLKNTLFTPCINGRVLAVGAYFGEAQSRLVDRLLSEQPLEYAACFESFRLF